MGLFFFLAISTLMCVLMASLPGLTFLIAIFWGACLILCALYVEKQKLLLVYIVNLGALYWLAGISTLFFYLSFFGIAAIVMSLLVTKGKEYYDLQKWGIAMVCLGVSVFLGIVYWSTGDIGINQMEIQIKEYMADSINYYEDNGLFEIYENQGILQDDFEKSMYGFATTIAKHLPAIYYLQAILAVFFMLLFASWVSLKRDIKRLKKRPYSQEIMPWQLVWIAIAGLLFWLIGREQMSLIYYAGSNILVILVPITVYFGLAALIFRFKQQKKGGAKLLTLLLVVIGVVFPLSAVIFLSLFGLFDALLDYRKLRIEE